MANIPKAVNFSGSQCGSVKFVADYTDNSPGESSMWKMDEPATITYSPGPLAGELYRPEVLETINTTINNLSPVLRDLSLDIHVHPELGFEERHAHDVLTQFVALQGFGIESHYLGLETAWRAQFSHGDGGRAIGVNSEMDALPGMGHACGHNLIAVAGVAVAVGIKAALIKHSIPGTIILLGTPAEENGGGKIILLERGAYKDMDACVMCHPFPGPVNSIGLGTSSARQVLEVEFSGRTAHAAGAPWKGQNALDAAFLAYAGLSALRQQMEPGTMSHGTISGRDWTPNVIPDYAKFTWMLRDRTAAQIATLRDKIKRCFLGAAIQADCTVEITEGQSYLDLRQNRALAYEFARNSEQGFGMNILSVEKGSSTASTDFGNVTYALPAIHPIYTVPIEPCGGNHTPAFARTAETQEAHHATMVCAKSLAATGLRLLDDASFFGEVRTTFEHEKACMPDAV